MSENSVVVNHEVLEEFVYQAFKKAGLQDKHARAHGKILVDTNLRGGDSHGVMRVPAYLNRVLNGAMNSNPDMKVISGSKAFEVIDGDDASGFTVGVEAMERAIEKAKEYKVGVIGAINSNHFGPSGYYARMAAEEGMVGICMTNVMPLIIAPGASEPVTGNNPFAIAAPTYGDFPFALDLSLSKVAGGKITLAIKKGEKIPTDWATDSEGRPTDDPQKAFEGFLMPMGDFKGLGLSYAMDILSGVITGGSFSHQVKSMYVDPKDPSLTSHLMIAIDISAIMGKEELKERMAQYMAYIKGTKMWDGNEMYLPGERAYIKTLDRMENGIPLPMQTYKELEELAEKLEIPFTLKN